MMLSEVTAVPQAALPVAAFREHLRLGMGFADDGVQDGLVEGYLRAALAAVERRTGKALIAREFRLVLEDWRGSGAQALPVAPVGALVSVTLRDAGGAAVPLALAAFRLVEDLQRPELAAVSGCLPGVPAGGSVEVVFSAGLGPAWSDLPADLAQAVLLLAAHYHENRHAAGGRAEAMPFGILALLERWRTLRTLGGGRA